MFGVNGVNVNGSLEPGRMTDKTPHDHNADFYKHNVVNVQETISTQTQSAKLVMCAHLTR